MMGRPSQINVALIGIAPGGIAYGPVDVTLTSYIGWHTTVYQLPIEDGAGATIQYSAGEARAPSGYAAGYSREGDTLIIVHTYDPTAPDSQDFRDDEMISIQDPRVPLTGGANSMQVGDCVN